MITAAMHMPASKISVAVLAALMATSTGILPARATAATKPAPPLAEDAPEGTDFVARFHLKAGRSTALKLHSELENVAVIRKQFGAQRAAAEKAVLALSSQLEVTTGVRLLDASGTVTIAVDFDAEGGTVWSAVVRGEKAPSSRKPDDTDDGDGEDGQANTRHYSIDDTQAFEWGDMHWLWLSDTLVLGDSRGIQRQLRRLTGRRKADHTIKGVVGRPPSTRLGPLHVEMILLPPAWNEFIADWLPDKKARRRVLKLLQGANSCNVWLTERLLQIRSDTDGKSAQHALLHGHSAWAAWMKAAIPRARAAVELRLSATQPPEKPKKSKAPKKAQKDDKDSEDSAAVTLDKLLKGPLFDVELTSKVSKRRPHVIESTVIAEGPHSLWPALALAMSWTGIRIVESQGVEAQVGAWMTLLREKELEHQEINGSLVACGPIPKRLPKAPRPWPKGSCFERVAFAPEGASIIQLQAEIQLGRLLLTARADPDGDGVPRVWYLDESSPTIREIGGK